MTAQVTNPEQSRPYARRLPVVLLPSEVTVSTVPQDGSMPIYVDFPPQK